MSDVFSYFGVRARGSYEGGCLRVDDFRREFGGRAYRNGLFRVHGQESVERVDRMLHEYFPETAGVWTALGSDWMGRVFAVKDTSEPESDRLAYIDPGCAKVNILHFTYNELVQEVLHVDGDLIFEQEYYTDWLEYGGSVPTFEACVGFDIPPFLGGSDGEENLKVQDMAVYWSIFGQLWSRIKGVPVGTPIQVADILSVDRSPQ